MRETRRRGGSASTPPYIPASCLPISRPIFWPGRATPPCLRLPGRVGGPRQGLEPAQRVTALAGREVVEHLRDERGIEDGVRPAYARAALGEADANAAPVGDVALA